MADPMLSQSMRVPPALPLRESGTSDVSDVTSVSTITSKTGEGVRPWSMADPRSTSQESIFSQTDAQPQSRRKLLAIYIHGFMGNEASFRSFPAHVHNLLSVLLNETHVIHTKIYPRYRSRRNISFARDDFSKWLEPHEGANVDVILLGHSMGGLLAAEVATLTLSVNEEVTLKHRILGTINLDVPFLGMHPGIIKSGLACLFLPGGEPLKDQFPVYDDGSSVSGSSVQSTDTANTINRPPARIDTLWAPGQQDPNYNPSFSNDVVLPIREGWRAAWHFINKHSSDLRTATKHLISSHMEFGGAMANYAELKMRYGRIRVLEEQDSNLRASFFSGAKSLPRVRFVNYYTACTGRPQKSRSPSPSHTPLSSRSEVDVNISDTQRVQPFLAMQDKELDDPEDSSTPTREIMPQSSTAHNFTDDSHDEMPPTSTNPDLRDSPILPREIDFTFIKDPNTRKLVEDEHRQAIEAYEMAVTRRESSLRSLEQVDATQTMKSSKPVANVVDAPEHNLRNEKKQSQKTSIERNVKMESTKLPPSSHQAREQLRLEQERERMAAEERRLRGESEIAKPEITVEEISTPPASIAGSDSIRRGSEVSNSYAGSIAGTATTTTTTNSSQKRLKERRFCNLPPKDSKGNRDPCWLRVFMKDVDEVGAHCGLFFIDEQYEKLVGEVASKIEEWVLTDASSRLVSVYS